MEKNIKLYNIFFPIRSFFIFPPLRIISLPLNFIIDSIVFLLTSILLKIKNYKTIYKKSILKIWASGFLADGIGAAFLFLGISLADITGNKQLTILNTINHTPTSNIFALSWTIVGVTISATAIFIFNYYWSFKNTNISEKEKRAITLSLAIFTAPYFFLIPISWIFSSTL